MRARLFAALALTAACYTPIPWDRPDQSDIDPIHTDCSGGETCVVVELGCCDHCNGGRAVAVAASAADAVLDAYGEVCRGDVGCTLMGCPPILAECEEAVCVPVQGEL